MHACSLIPHVLLLLAGYAAVQGVPVAWAAFPEQVSRGALLAVTLTLSAVLVFCVTVTVLLYKDLIRDVRKTAKEEVELVQGKYVAQRDLLSRYRGRAEAMAVVLAWERRRADDPADLPIDLSDYQVERLERFIVEMRGMLAEKKKAQQ